jgi:hypothetical protein
MKCHKCGGSKIYSGGCHGEWECWGECAKAEKPKMKNESFSITWNDGESCYSVDVEVPQGTNPYDLASEAAHTITRLAREKGGSGEVCKWS